MPGTEGRENRELVFHGYRVSAWEDGRVLELDGGGDCMSVWVYLMPLYHTLKSGYSGKFHVYFIRMRKFKSDKNWCIKNMSLRERALIHVRDLKQERL